MFITFSHPLDRAAYYVEAAARKHGARAAIGHVRLRVEGTEVRFTLESGDDSGLYATAETHDLVILQLLKLDPQAKVRTARAVYEDLADFESQMAARVG